MCGIVAVVGQRAEDKVLSAMLDAVEARGPDGRESVSGDWFSVGFCRLAIYALEAGRQPVRSPDGAVTLAFNGEIYNFEALAERLGIRAASEAELLLQGYLAHGSSFVSQLDGDFAVVIVDEKRRVCELWRDRFGVKPLYYTMLPGRRLLISSEIRGLLAHPDFVLGWDELALAERYVLTFWSTERTTFKGVRQILPGHRTVIGPFDGSGAEGGALHVEEIPYTPERQISVVGECEVVKACTDTLQASIAKRVQHTQVSPVVVALSGGIDSSLLAALARRASSELTAITICGGPDELDARHSTLLASKLGIEHHLYTVSTERLLEVIPAVVLAQPANGAFLAWFLAEAMQRLTPSAKVLLCGEGADEMFHGYRVHSDPAGFKAQTLDALSAVSDLEGGSALLRRVRGWEQMEPAAYYEDVTALFLSAQLVNRHLVPFDHGTMARRVECRVPFLGLEMLDLHDRTPRRALGPNKPLLRRALNQLPELDASTRDALLTRQRTAGYTATEAARAGLRRLLMERGLTRSRLMASKIMRFSRNPEELFWLGAAHVVYFERRGKIDGMDFETLLEEAFNASPEW
ncbi:asparagine synthetase B family protein [Sorangium sp. So ce1099]|uniref:asparagine synthetase B family protein n=1 Tax=Sorangium sp. So ce1099 TaxID=3133331 RepID=UPI003F5E2B7D